MVIIITKETLKKIIAESRESEQKRKSHILRSFRESELPSTIFNTLQPGTYIRPHKHLSSNAKEIIIANQGKSIAVFFDENGEITESFIISLLETNYLEIPSKTYHTVIALEPDTVICEIYMANHSNNIEYKEFAPWSPEEKTKEVEEYLNRIEKEARLFANRENRI